MCMAATAGPHGLEYGSKGATVHQALRWRYPRVFLMRAPRPSDYDSTHWHRCRWYLDPLWGEVTGARLYRQKPGPARVRPYVPPSQWGRPPHRRLAYLEGLEAGGIRSHNVGVDWWRRVWDNDPARTTPPYPPVGASWKWVAREVHFHLSQVTDVWWGLVPTPGEAFYSARATHAFERLRPGLNRDHALEAASEARRLAANSEAGGPPMGPAPRLLLVSRPPPPAEPGPPP